QIQMQSGTTGINIPRIYNPTLQAQRLDPSGKFIRQWVPELANVSTHWIHEPWKMGTRQQAQFGVVIGQDYPAPLVDFDHAARVAKLRLTEIRDQNFVQTSRLIGERHGSRKRSASRKPKTASRNKKTDTSQLDLF
ncbi:MAG: FAD-binding domain-containing protein, partial [Oleibacter sp.]|nr:FAD-binding domain-containing protein [Thalassolituus sp.]